MFGSLATALTWFKAFKPQCLYLTGACLLAGSCAGGIAGWNTATWKANSTIGALKLDAQKVKTDQAEFEARLAKREIEIRDEVQREYQPKIEAINQLAAAVRNLGAGVRVCGQQTKIEFSSPAAGVIEAGPSEQSRPAERALIDLATRIAERCDQQGLQLNALIDWVTAKR